MELWSKGKSKKKKKKKKKKKEQRGKRAQTVAAVDLKEGHLSNAGEGLPTKAKASHLLQISQAVTL
jgi:hypothetical protein